MSIPQRRRALLRERLARQGLAPVSSRTVEQGVAVTTAIQAQDNPAARLGVRVRAAGSSEAGVQAAIARREVVRTWLLRGTIHLVAATDLRWLVRLVGPTVERAMRTRWRQLGLSDALLERTLELLPGVLADGPRTRHEIAAALIQAGLPLAGLEPQVPTHVVLHASTTGLLCRGPEAGRHTTFALLDDWLPGSPVGPSGDEALAELARRYFTAYSPATAADFTTWSGFGSSRAIELIRDELTPCDVDGAPGFRLGEVEPARGVRLLPAFDNYVLGYRDRTALLAGDRHPHVYQGGMIRATVVDDGAVVGTWRTERTGDAVRVEVSAFAPLTRRAQDGVRREAADVARFLGRELAGVGVTGVEVTGVEVTAVG